MEKFFSLLWASILSVLTTILVRKLVNNFELIEKSDFLSELLDFIHNYHCSASYIMCLALIIFFLVTGLHRDVGALLFYTIGFVTLIVMAVLAIVGVFYFLQFVLSFL